MENQESENALNVHVKHVIPRKNWSRKVANVTLKSKDAFPTWKGRLKVAFTWRPEGKVSSQSNVTKR